MNAWPFLYIAAGLMLAALPVKSVHAAALTVAAYPAAAPYVQKNIGFPALQKGLQCTLVGVSGTTATVRFDWPAAPQIDGQPAWDYLLRLINPPIPPDHKFLYGYGSGNLTSSLYSFEIGPTNASTNRGRNAYLGRVARGTNAFEPLEQISFRLWRTPKGFETVCHR